MNALDRRALAALAVALLLATAAALAQTETPEPGFVVVVNAANPIESLSVRGAADLFLRRTKTWPDNSVVHPVDQVATSSARRAFSLAVFGKEADAIVSFWFQQIYSGRGVSPPQLKDDAAVIAFVAANPGAVGYVATTTLPAEVKAVPLGK